MRISFFVILFVFATFPSFAQQKKVRKIVPLYTQQDIYLNGGIRANFGGKSRLSFDIVLPQGTVEWYYTLTTTAGAPSQAINLIPQLTRLLDPTGVTGIAVSSIIAPTGANVCDSYLMDKQGEVTFLQMADINIVKRFPTDSRQNFRNGTVQVRDVIIPGTYVLGFRNPSATAGIGISFEAAAIIEEITLNPDAEKAVTYGNLGWKAYESGDINQCIDYSKKALTLDPTLGYVKANLGLCYLIQGDQNIATDYYIDALSDLKKINDKNQSLALMEAVIRDINGALKKQPDIKGSAQIKSMYQSEVLKNILNRN